MRGWLDQVRVKLDEGMGANLGEGMVKLT